MQEAEKISTEKLENEFICTVCCNPIDDCFITRCGHVYCRTCIQEVRFFLTQIVNRHHRCPFCNTELADFNKDVFKNYHFNTLKKIVDDERSLLQKHYFSRVFQLPQITMIEDPAEKALLEPV